MTDELQFLTNEDHAPVVLYITNENFEFQGDAVYAKVKQMTDIPFDFCELPVANWDDCLTPWATDPQMKGRSFTGGGKQLLEKIGENVLPLIDEKLPNHREIYIAGYSLAGLFSLWTLYECDRFDGAVCCSGSLWYPGWSEYMEQTSLQKKSDVYLSLGKKEPHTKHPLMKKSGEMMALQYEHLMKDLYAGKITFEWQEGGHFDHVEDRIVRGIYWILTETGRDRSKYEKS